jgi:hypothetical protein
MKKARRGYFVWDFEKLFYVKYVICVQKKKAWFVLEMELWNIKVEGVQELWQLRASTSRSWFSMIKRAMAISFKG